MELKHTPGPWKATRDPHGSRSDYCIGMATDVARIDRVAVCSACDASLISAAPELLEACILARHICEDGNALQQQLDAAIAKALGKE